jgi:membrane protein DedA with SNARE-associated domain
MVLMAMTPLLLALGTLAVLLVAAVIFAETGLVAGFFLPGDGILFFTGVLVATHRIDLPIWLVVAVLFAAAALGDQLGYVIGRRVGPRLLGKERRWLPADVVAKGQLFFDRHGPRAVVIARFVPWARTLVPVLAGAAQMERGRFVAFNVAGGLLWTGLLALGGYFLGGVPLFAEHFEHIVIGMVALSVIPALIGLSRKLAKRRRPQLLIPLAAPAVD